MYNSEINACGVEQGPASEHEDIERFLIKNSKLISKQTIDKHY